jgi:hypothetical protein
LSTTSHAVLDTLCSGTALTTLQPQLDDSFPRLHVKLDSHTVERSLLASLSI